MTKRMAMGISQPAGRSRTFSEKGRSFWRSRLVVRLDANDSERTATTSSCFIVIRTVATKIRMLRMCQAAEAC